MLDLTDGIEPTCVLCYYVTGRLGEDGLPCCRHHFHDCSPNMELIEFAPCFKFGKLFSNL